MRNHRSLRLSNIAMLCVNSSLRWRKVELGPGQCKPSMSYKRECQEKNPPRRLDGRPFFFGIQPNRVDVVP
jgi:hypothetical protein